MSSPSTIGPSLESPSLIDMLLEEQQTTAVERFARLHEQEAPPTQAKYYRDLIPLTVPTEGEQYAFEVDLDACTGCKSCVAACHNMNGLEKSEFWRSVGFLHGGSAAAPVVQHVTTACHHCVDPACMSGCPVNAYDKHPVTGIVKHLDDQCIGCQYCILKCPYDAPKYSKSKGIVRKCDMCSDRLAGGEAPLCVQSCPNQAIRITVVNQQEVIAESEANVFLPGAPEPGYTRPSTIYRAKTELPKDLLPADYYNTPVQHGHLPLVFMLVLTQMSVGAFFVDQLLANWIGPSPDAAMLPARVAHLVAALVLGLVGVNAAVLHLGRPLYAFRAVIGLRTSWLSREIVAFGLFAMMASIYVGSECLWYGGVHVPLAIRHLLGIAAVLSGFFGLLCSAMIYISTRRPLWSWTRTGLKFFGTALLLGFPVTLLIALGAAVFSETLSARATMDGCGRVLCMGLIATAAAKLLYEACIFAALRHPQHTPIKRTALLMTGVLGPITLKRFFFGTIGGIVLPGLLLLDDQLVPDGGFTAGFIILTAVLMLLVSVIGELLERYLFFAAVVAPKMPGSPAS